MPVVAKRIQYLDQETNTGVADFNTINGGSLFNTGQDIATSASNKVTSFLNGSIASAKSSLGSKLTSLGLPNALSDIGIDPKELINGRLSSSTDINVVNKFIDAIVPDQLQSYVGSYSLTNQQKLSIASMALGHIGNSSSGALGFNRCFGNGLGGTFGNAWDILDKILASFMNALLGNSTALINCLVNQYKGTNATYSNGVPVLNQNTVFGTVGGKTFNIGNLTYIQIAPNNWRIKNILTGAFADNVVYSDVYVYTKVNPSYYITATKSLLNGFYDYIRNNNITIQYRCVDVNGAFTYSATDPTAGGTCTSVYKVYILPMGLFNMLYTSAFPDSTMPKPNPANYYDTNKDFITYMLTTGDVTLMNYDPSIILNLGA